MFPYTACEMFFNSLGPNGTIWRQRSGSTLAQVMACCLTAPSHYLNQCWLLISDVSWHSSENNWTVSAQAIILYNNFENDALKITATSPRGQWVNSLWLSGAYALPGLITHIFITKVGYYCFKWCFCSLLCAKPLSAPMLAYCQFSTREHVSMKF